MNHKLSLRVIALLMLLGLLFLPFSAPHAQEGGFIETFDDPELSGWQRSSGVQVRDGILHIDPGNFAFRPGAWGGDMSLKLSIRRSAPGNFVVSYQIIEGRAYHVVIGGPAIVLQREFEGVVEDLTSSESPDIPVGEWFQIGILLRGNEHTVLFNEDIEVLAFSDPSPHPPGGIAVEVVGDAAIEVDNLELVMEGRAGTADEADQPVEPAAGGETAPGSADDLPALPWVYTGGPSGGLGYDIRMDPRNPDVLFVTDAWAGAFKTKDGGMNWYPINNGITARAGPSGDGIPVFSLTIDPNDPDTLWVGTQFGGGVLRSEDGGESWASKSNGILERALTIRGFTVEPGNSNVVYLAGEISSWEWNGSPLPGTGLDMVKGAVYKTIDGGANWTRIWYGDNLTRYIWIHPEDHELIYVSTGIFDREAANSNPDAKEPGGVGILRSRDGGATWEVLGVGNGIRADELYFGSLSMHPGDPDVLIGAAGNDPYLWLLGRDIGGIYRTQNSGDSWERLLNLPNASAVEICESDPDVVYAASVSSFYRSEDGGDSWKQEGGTGDVGQTGAALWGPPDVIAGFPIDMQCDPREPLRVFVNNYGGGNFLSQDGGANWVNASKGYTGALMHQVVVTANDPAHIYASARSGIFSSSDGGQTWSGMSRGVARAMEGHAIAVDPQDPSHLIAVIGDAGPVPKVSNDGGQSWQEAKPELGQGSFFEWGAMRKVVFSPTQPGRVIGIQGEVDCIYQLSCSAGHGVIFSEDGGAHWALSNLIEGVGTEVAFGPKGNAYVAIEPGDLYRSTDGGETWELLVRNLTSGIELQDSDPALSGPVLTSLAVDPQNPDRLYAGFTRGGVMVSEDGGASWQASSSGMVPEASIMDLVTDRANPGVVYAAALDSGVYRSTDGGETWLAINDGLLTRAAKSLALSADGRVLYLATEGGGVFRLGAAPLVITGTQTESAVDSSEETPTSPDEPLSNLPCPGGLAPLAIVGAFLILRRRS
jgi:photosystem II stability/assembly factor-like uncharacterized protein